MKVEEIIKKLHDALAVHHKEQLKSKEYQKGKLCDQSLMALVAARDFMSPTWQPSQKARPLNPIQRSRRKS